MQIISGGVLTPKTPPSYGLGINGLIYDYQMILLY